MKIYIAGPFSKGSTSSNIREAVKVADYLLHRGHCPFVPHLAHLWDMIIPLAYADALKWDFEWLEKCDAIVRIPGESPGADLEIDMAKGLRLKLFSWDGEKVIDGDGKIL
jgi:hypothetical protein